jgi:hypothetical protein
MYINADRACGTYQDNGSLAFEATRSPPDRRCLPLQERHGVRRSRPADGEEAPYPPPRDTHKLIPWHEASYQLDDENGLFRETEVLLEVEANLAAALLIFQGRCFHDRALDYENSIKTPILLADQFGPPFTPPSASMWSTTPTPWPWRLRALPPKRRDGARAPERRVQVFSAAVRVHLRASACGAGNHLRSSRVGAARDVDSRVRLRGEGSFPVELDDESQEDHDHR